MKEEVVREEIRNQLKRLVKETKALDEAPEIDLDFDPSGISGIPAPLKKLLDPKISPQKFAALDQKLDTTGSDVHKAFAILAFALSYSENDSIAATKLLRRAIQLAPKVQKQMDAASKKKAK